MYVWNSCKELNKIVKGSTLMLSQYDFIDVSDESNIRNVGDEMCWRQL